MKYRKSDHPLLNTKEKGSVEWVMGLFSILFIMLFAFFELQVIQYKTTSQYLEDALALSGLASALIDVKEFGAGKGLCITDTSKAYETYMDTLETNLGLDGDTARNTSLISGKVEVNKYYIYNVSGDRVIEIGIDSGGVYLRREGKLGEMCAPNGQKIEATSVYSEITFPVKGFLGLEVTANKGKLVEVNQSL